MVLKEVARAKLWEGEKKAYMESIDVKMTGDFSALVWSDYKNADEIEHGRPPRDLKAMLATSLKVRVSKKGKRYLIIPFRHNTPGATALAAPMPPAIYKQAKALAPSSIAGMTQRPSGQKGKQHVMVPQAVYNWGGKLPAELAPKLKPHHKTDIYAGMYRFNTSSGKQKSSAYMTFRTMIEGSPGWIIPAQPGLFLAKKVAEEMQPIAAQAFQKAVVDSF